MAYNYNIFITLFLFKIWFGWDCNKTTTVILQEWKKNVIY